MAPLDGIRVLDFSHALAGPYCTMLLADYGAEVIKLESADGDMGRGWGPPFSGGESHFFLALNRGKLGLTLDLKTGEGLAACLGLVDTVDVLVENFRPGTMERLGLGYAALRERNPRLIYCSISGYGQTGPSRDATAMDLVMQAACGLLSITGTAGGELARCGYGVTDVTAGQFAVIGILLALQARARTGLGQMVDVSMFDGMISTMSSNFASFLGSGEVPRPMGTRFPTVVPYCTLETADRPVAIAVGSEKLWRAFCAAIGREHWATDEAYRTNALRIANRATLEPQLNEWFRTRTSAEWCERLGAAGVPCSPVRDFAEVVADPQSEARGMFPSRMHPAAGEHRVTGTPVKLSATPGGSLRPAPALGADTDEVLRRVPD